jgi:PST family polysaccharide transporter
MQCAQRLCGGLLLPQAGAVNEEMKDLKGKTIRGGFARILAQTANFLFRVGSLMILARLLDPKDFGLVGMVAAFTGVLGLFRDFGLSSATVQRETVTEEQLSTLFWINVLVGAVLATLAVVCAPVMVKLYHEPRLFAITMILSTAFLFNALGVQHSAILQRQMRFTALAAINIASLVVSTAAAVTIAKLGYGYWALVAMTIAQPLTTTLGLWIITVWVPGIPRRGTGIRSMIRFGGTITLNVLIVYVAYNMEKVLLGRFWGADAIGIYGRAYQLINIPTDNLNTSIGEVAFSALSRVQDDALRLRNYFLKGYAVLLALTIPITIVSALFANDLVAVLLGPKWKEAATIFRLLAPTILIFGMINPLGWLLFSTGLVVRSLKVSLVLAPIVIAGYLIGLPFGPKGVALAYSTAMTLWVIPHIAWCVHGTMVSLRDVLLTVARPLLSGIVAAVAAFGVQFFFGQSLVPLARLVLGSSVLFGVYILMLLFAMGQKEFYFGLMRGMRSVEESELVSA